MAEHVVHGVDINAVLSAVPGIVTRQGEALCKTTPLYKAKAQQHVIYVNEAAFARIFPTANAAGFEQMAAVLEAVFSTTIEPDLADGAPIGTAYVDYQADPLDVSLSGNLGSGRAYYIGACFNVKGEKTPLATSSKKQFSDGFLEMERAIWEAVVANSLQGSFANGLNDVLCILDMDSLCDVDWREKPVRRGKVIRCDNVNALGIGTLDRITHQFYLKTPLSKDRLTDMAAGFGRMEGDKFTERIVHGTWSGGNLSPAGHLIDFDTVGATAGRAPCYSSTRWYADNRFGYEYRGQEKILTSLAADKDINVDGIAADALTAELHKARDKEIRQGFVKLMGVARHLDWIESHHKDVLDDLTDLYIQLSQKACFKDGGFLTKDLAASYRHIFDVSRFMRFYPLIHGDDDALDIGLDLLIGEDMGEGDLTPVSHPDMNDIEREYIDAVYDVIGDSIVEDALTYKMLKIAAQGFVKAYAELMESVFERFLDNAIGMQAAAYVLNEPRLYLMPYFTATYDVAKKAHVRPQPINNQMISDLVISNSRIFTPDQKIHIADIRHFEQGIYATKVINDGNDLKFQKILKPRDSVTEETIEVQIDDIEPFVMSLNGDVYEGEMMDGLDYLEKVFYENALHMPNIILNTQYEYNGDSDVIAWMPLPEIDSAP